MEREGGKERERGVIDVAPGAFDPGATERVKCGQAHPGATPPSMTLTAV